MLNYQKTLISAKFGFELKDSATFSNDEDNLALDLDTMGLNYSVGDLVLLATCTNGYGDGDWSWVTTGTNIDIHPDDDCDFTQYDYPGGFIGSSIIESGKSTFTTTDVDGWAALSGIIAIFSNATFESWSGVSSGNRDNPQPPGHSVVEGDILIAAGFLDDDAVDMTAPSGYTLIKSNNHTFDLPGPHPARSSSIALAYKVITSTGTEFPGEFGGPGNDEWAGVAYNLREA